MNILNLHCKYNIGNIKKNLPLKLTNDNLITKVKNINEVINYTKDYVNKWNLTKNDFNGKLYIKNHEFIVNIHGKIFDKQNDEIKKF